MWDKSSPHMNLEVEICTSQTGQKMILPHSDDAIRGVVPVSLRRDQLPIDALPCHLLLQDVGGFLVQALKLVLEASLCKVEVEILVGALDFVLIA